MLKFSIDSFEFESRHLLCLMTEIANQDYVLCLDSSVSLCQWDLSSL